MRNLVKSVFLGLVCLLALQANAQLTIVSLESKVIASSQKDSVLIELGEGALVREPRYIGGTPKLKQYVLSNTSIADWKAKKAGVYTAYVSKNWDEISVTSDSKKAKDADLISIATALKKSAHLWSSYTVGDTAITRYTLQIRFEIK